jgi:hypothetical protein
MGGIGAGAGFMRERRREKTKARSQGENPLQGGKKNLSHPIPAQRFEPGRVFVTIYSISRDTGREKKSSERYAQISPEHRYD